MLFLRDSISIQNQELKKSIIETFLATLEIMREAYSYCYSIGITPGLDMTPWLLMQDDRKMKENC